MCPDVNTNPKINFEEVSQQWRAVINSVSDLTDKRFESPSSHSKDERVTARPTGKYFQSKRS